MSHFAVLVHVPASKTLEEVMMPYHEFECTGIEQHIQNIDMTAEVQAKIDEKQSLDDGLGYFGLDDRIVSDESQVDISGDHKYGYAVAVDGKLIKAIDRTNPNKKWDWYTVGGRWSGYFGRNTGTKFQMNFERIRQEYLAEKMKKYYDFHAARKNAAVTLGDIERAQETLTGYWKNNEKAQALYKSPVEMAFDSKAFEDLKHDMWSIGDAAEMHLSENEYHAKHEYAAPLHSFIDQDGKWIEVGDMGWWGMCSNENADTFNGKDGLFWSFVNSLPDDAMLYVVDCHI